MKVRVRELEVMPSGSYRLAGEVLLDREEAEQRIAEGTARAIGCAHRVIPDSWQAADSEVSDVLEQTLEDEFEAVAPDAPDNKEDE